MIYEISTSVLVSFRFSPNSPVRREHAGQTEGEEGAEGHGREGEEGEG